MRQSEWTDIVRDALRDAEATPPAGGWARLERSLADTPPRMPVRIRRLLRVAAAAAVLLIGFGVGEWLRPTDVGAGMPGERVAAEVPAPDPATDDAAAPGELLAEAPTTGADVPRAAAPAAGQVRRSSGTHSSVPLLGAEGADSGAGASAAGSAVRPENSAGSAADAPIADSASEKCASEERASEKPASVRRTPSVAPARRTRPAREFVAAVPDRKGGLSLALFAAGGVASRSVGHGLVSRSPLVLSDNGADQTLMPISEYEQASFRHHQPLGFGLSVRKEFGHGFSLETGVNYTLLWADVRLPNGSEEFSQKLHFIGVPLRANWNFLDRKRIVLYIGAGGMVETCVGAKFGSTSFDEPGAFWSVLGAAGAECRLGGRVGFYCEPEISYVFNATRLHTSRTESPASFTLRLGVRMSF